MSLLLYAVEVKGLKNKGFLITTKERSEKDLVRFDKKSLISNRYSFIKEILKQDIIPVYNRNILRNLNLRIDVSVDEWNIYDYFFKDVYKIGDFKVKFDIVAERVEKERADLNKFDITLVDKNNNKIIIDANDEEIVSINSKEVYDYKLNDKLSKLIEDSSIQYDFGILLEEFEEPMSTRNIIELTEIKENTNIENFIDKVYSTIVENNKLVDKNRTKEKKSIKREF